MKRNRQSMINIAKKHQMVIVKNEEVEVILKVHLCLTSHPGKHDIFRIYSLVFGRNLFLFDLIEDPFDDVLRETDGVLEEVVSKSQPVDFLFETQASLCSGHQIMEVPLHSLQHHLLVLEWETSNQYQLHLQ